MKIEKGTQVRILAEWSSKQGKEGIVTLVEGDEVVVKVKGDPDWITYRFRAEAVEKLGEVIPKEA